MTAGHRALISVGMAAIAVGTLSGFRAPAAAASADPIGFGTPTVMDPVHTYGEPNIGINPADGSMYDSGPQGTGVQRSGWEGSVDGGSTFRIVGQCPATSLTTTVSTQSCAAAIPPSAAASQYSVETAPGGGDAEQKFDHNGNQYFADLYGLACQRVAETSNDGATAPESPLGCGNTAPTCAGTPTSPTACPGEGSDRQWLSVLDPGFLPGHPSVTPSPATAPDHTHYAGPYPVVYMEYNNLNTVQSNCSTWLMSGNPGNTSGIGLTYQAANNTTTGNFGCDGYPSIDQETGQLLEASSCSTTGSTNSICLNIATPDSTGFLHFLDDSGGPGLIPVVTGLQDSGADLFVVSSIDSAQNLHVTYGVAASDPTARGSGQDWQIYTTIASAATGWTNWATPVEVSQAPSDVNIFPWVAAGDGPLCETSAAAQVACAGRSDSTWYGSNDNTEGPSGTTPGDQVWNVYMAQVVWPVDSITSATPGAYAGGAPLSNTMVRVTPHPMQYGEICLLGTACITAQGNRNVADYFEVNVDEHGAAVISYDDNSNNLLQTGFPSTAQALDHAGAGVITMARQTNGPGLLGTDVAPACSGPAACPWSNTSPNYQSSVPTTGMTDAGGDARYPVIGGANLPGVDLTGNSLSLSGSTLTVSMNVADLSNAAIASVFNPTTGVPAATVLTYVTRWLEPSAANQGTCSLPSTSPSTPSTACTLFFAEAQVTPGAPGGPPSVSFYAGTAQSIDLCSVSACFPHVVYYPDDGVAAHGSNQLTSGTTFDVTNGTISMQVPVADVGNPSQSTLLEEVGSYAFAADHTQSLITNAQAQADDVPLEIDGVCCFNFEAGSAAAVPETPWGPALIALGAAAVLAGVVRRRRLSVRRA